MTKKRFYCINPYAMYMETTKPSCIKTNEARKRKSEKKEKREKEKARKRKTRKRKSEKQKPHHKNSTRLIRNVHNSNGFLIGINRCCSFNHFVINFKPDRSFLDFIFVLTKFK